MRALGRDPPEQRLGPLPVSRFGVQDGVEQCKLPVGPFRGQQVVEAFTCGFDVSGRRKLDDHGDVFGIRGTPALCRGGHTDQQP